MARRKNIQNNAVPKKQRTQKQREAAIQNLKKARDAKKHYAELRSAGFSSENIDAMIQATNAIEEMMHRFSSYNVESNPAVMQLMEEIGDFKTKSEIMSMSMPEFYKYATSIRTFMAAPLSDPDAIDNMTNRLVNELVGGSLLRKKGESRSVYMKRRKEFIEDNKDTASKAFALFRQLENTHAGLILKGKISPDAYGSDNLIVDLFDFIESEYDGDFDKAYNFWIEKLQEQFQESQAQYHEFGEKGRMKKFNWRGGDLYGKFTTNAKAASSARKGASKRKRKTSK